MEVASSAASACGVDGPLVLAQASSNFENQGQVADGSRMRLYLLDLPGGSAEILAIAIAAPESEFERVVGEATPIVESIEFHTP